MHPKQLADLKSKLEKYLHKPEGNTITAQRLAELDEARDYDAASSYNYLFVELMVIKHAVARGRSITFESTPPQTLDSIDTFVDWALDRYPAFRNPGYHDLYLDTSELVRSGDL